MVRSVSTVLSGQAWRAAEPLAVKHPVALPGAYGINGNQFLALVVHKNAQMHVIQTGNAEGADQRVGYLHDLHQAAGPPEDFVEGEELGEGDAVFGGSGSQ